MSPAVKKAFDASLNAFDEAVKDLPRYAYEEAVQAMADHMNNRVDALAEEAAVEEGDLEARLRE